MAHLVNRAATYHAADLFRVDCLDGEGSLLWPTLKPWTLDNLRALRSAILEHLDESSRTFFEKLQDQLSPEPAEASRIAADILGFYYLFPMNIGAQTKASKLRQVISWKGLSDGLDLTSVEAAYTEGGIGKPGLYYNTGIPWLFVFLVQLGIASLEDRPDFADMHQLEALCDRAQKGIPGSTNAIRNVALHLLLPESFEPIASDRHKSQILESFESHDPKVGSVDSRLLKVRERLSNEIGRPDFGFYDDDVISRWKPDTEAGIDAEEQAAGMRVWIEKTKVKDRPDRLSGSEALGNALWSPQRSESGGDIYRFMREVKPQDIILHLTDNQAFTGRSIVAREADDRFVGLPNTEWAGVPAYRVQLRNYTRIEPPLDRQVFFGEPYKSQLRRIAADGTKNLFFNKEPTLNQGAYLTPAPPRLVQVLAAAYKSHTGGDLLDGQSATAPLRTAVTATSEEPTQVERIWNDFGEALRDCGVAFGNRHSAIVRSFVASLATKRFVILTGLSGSGKTQLALKFGQWLGKDRYLVVAVRPDWTGSDAIFGFEDALQKVEQGRRSWQVPSALRFMLQAARDPSNPYLLLLDEMNLAHVERYFADVLSGMESEQPALPNVSVGPDGHWRLVADAEQLLPVPRNLFIVGTVNVDETTYMFSPKVLDRANTFEFRVATTDLAPEARRPVNCEPGPPDLVASFAAISGNPDWHNEHPAPHLASFVVQLKRIHELLSTFGFEYGHRTFIEAVRFAALYAATGDTNELDALDLQIMQKMLPRLHGARRQMEPVLRALGLFCIDPIVFPFGDAAAQQMFDPANHPVGAPKLPISFDKIKRMISILRANQFVSFTE
jgi:energy-coupling factor transporter ATP-binding protein EcfA2